MPHDGQSRAVDPRLLFSLHHLAVAVILQAVRGSKTIAVAVVIR
jgi:hypothetical protein